MTPAELAEELAKDLAARAAQVPVLTAVLQGAVDAYADYQAACCTPGDPAVRELRVASYVANDCAGLALLALTARPCSEDARDEARLAVKAYVRELCGPPTRPAYAGPDARPRLYPPAPEPEEEDGQEDRQEGTP